MNTLLADLRNLKSVILDAFHDGATPAECAVRLGERGFHPVPRDSDLLDHSPLIETIKQVLLDEFYQDERVKWLFGYAGFIKTMNKATFKGVEHVFRSDERIPGGYPKPNWSFSNGNLGFNSKTSSRFYWLTDSMTKQQQRYRFRRLKGPTLTPPEADDIAKTLAEWIHASDKLQYGKVTQEGTGSKKRKRQGNSGS